MNMKKVPVMTTLLNTFKMMKMCLIMRMGFHNEITTGWEGKYWLCGRVISLYYRMIIPGKDTCCLWMPRNMQTKK